MPSTLVAHSLHALPFFIRYFIWYSSYLDENLILLFLLVFTIHILFYAHTFPMAFCLFPNKERQTYNRVFMLLKDAALVLGLTSDPLVIVSDFELAMVQASTMSFPNSYHHGCYYHFKQAIWRKVYAC